MGILTITVDLIYSITSPFVYVGSCIRELPRFLCWRLGISARFEAHSLSPSLNFSVTGNKIQFLVLPVRCVDERAFECRDSGKQTCGCANVTRLISLLPKRRHVFEGGEPGDEQGGSHSGHAL